jgi:hypothetical protein
MKTNLLKVCELTGAALDWAVAMALGKRPSMFIVKQTGKLSAEHNYSTDWAQGGPIIDREHISTAYVYWGEWEAWDDKTMPPPKYRGPSPLIAAMRCYVASKLGDDVEVPEELVCQ